MAFQKTNDGSQGMALGMTLADAREIVEKEGYMFQYLPKIFQTKELQDLAETWWENHFMKHLDHYRSHPREVAQILAQARVAGKSIVVSEDMRFDVELEEIN